MCVCMCVCVCVCVCACAHVCVIVCIHFFRNSFPFALLTLSKEEIAKSKDMTKLLASVSV